MTDADLPDRPADISDWILRQATESHDGDAMLDGLGRALNRAGLPVWRLGIGAPAIDPIHRGITVTWQRGVGTSLSPTAHGEAGEASFARSPIAALAASRETSRRWDLSAREGCETLPLLDELRRLGGTDYVLHLVRFPRTIAIEGTGLSYVTDRAGGFSEADLRHIEDHLPALGLAVLRLCLSATLDTLLGAYMGPRTARRVLAGQVRRGQGEVMAAAILLADLKSFTATTDHEDPRQVVAWLDQHLEALGQDVERDGGEILKFTGDGFIAVFPVADRAAAPCAVCRQALDTARAALARNRALGGLRARSGEPALAADVALHFGDVVYGNVGTASRLDFTAIGRAVNEASRIETLCDATGRNLLVSDSFARRCGVPLTDLGEFALRGVEAPQRLWTVDG